jgi:hypothetical protein
MTKIYINIIWGNYIGFFLWHWLRLPGLGNNNEKLGLPERLSAGI